MQRYRPLAAILAFFLVVSMFFGAMKVAPVLASSRISCISTDQHQIAYTGSGMAKAGLGRDDILPLLGASELWRGTSRYKSFRFFRRAPSGFRVLQISSNGAASLALAQVAAGIGPDLRGKKIALTFTPHLFEVPTVSFEDFSLSFVAYHAYQTLLSRDLPLGLRQRIARQLLTHDYVFESEPLLHYFTKKLATSEKSILNKISYWAALPLAWSRLKILEGIDNMHLLVRTIHRGKCEAPVAAPSHTINWTKHLQRAHFRQRALATNNPYGIVNAAWNWGKVKLWGFYPNGTQDGRYLEQLAGSPEWTDFEILLEVLTELGAKVLLLEIPMKASLYDARGVSAAARSHYYARINQIAAHYKVTLADFEALEVDNDFGIDDCPHLGHVGWVRINQVLDAFYHDQPFDKALVPLDIPVKKKIKHKRQKLR